MLTDRDIHYLSGLLLLVSTDSNVRIDLGKTIVDATINKARDVDVVLTTSKADVDEQSFGGIEVKDHRRKLDVTHVEQLGAKLRDMPNLTQRGIVSASGYTASALMKCKAYDVLPMNLQPFTPAQSPFDFIQFPPDFCFSCSMLVCQSPISLSYQSGSNRSFIDASAVDRRCHWLVNGKRMPEIASVKQLNDHVLAGFLDAIDGINRNQLADNTPMPVDTDVHFGNDVCEIELDGIRFPIDSVAIRGFIIRQVTETPLEWLALVRADTGEYIAGSGIATIADGSLVGIVMTHDTRQPSIIRVSPTERAKRLIRNLTLERS